MISLASTSDLLQAVTSSTASTDVHASYVDQTATGFAAGRKNTAISSAATTTVVASPAAGTVRRVESLAVRNRHASTSQTVTLQHTDGSTSVELVKMALAAGETLVYQEGVGFFVLDASGAQKVAQSGTGRYLRSSVLTSGTSFTTGMQTVSAFVRLLGGGGAGGGAGTGAAGNSCGGAGGGSGGYAEKTFTVTPNTAYTYAIGAAGTAGAAGANPGGVGGDTTFAVGATTVTAKGGNGGLGMAAGTAVAAVLGGAPTAVSTNGDVNAAGGPGAPGLRFSGAAAMGGTGASSPFGGGGNSVVLQGGGNAAVGFGSGGGGGAQLNGGANTAGGAGAGGLIVVDEYA